MNFFTVLHKELTEQWRSSRALIVMAVLVVFGLASPLLARFTPELLKAIPDVPAELLAAIPAPTRVDAVAQYIKNMSQFGILLALFMGMGLVVQEKERGTAAFFLTRPVSRETFLLAKFCAQALLFTASLSLAALGCWTYTRVLFEPLAWGPFLALNGLMLIVFLVYTAVALLASTLAPTHGVSVGLALAALVVIAGLGSLPRIGDFLPGRLFGWGAAQMFGSSEPAWSALAVSLALIVLSLLAAVLAFRRQEV